MNKKLIVMSKFDYNERIKHEYDITLLIDFIRNITRKMFKSLYLEKEILSDSDIQHCIEQVWVNILNSDCKPDWLVYTNPVKENITSFIHNFIKHEHDNCVSMGSASSIYWHKMLDSRYNLYELLRKQ
jgi:hypothetical protein